MRRRSAIKRRPAEQHQPPGSPRPCPLDVAELVDDIVWMARADGVITYLNGRGERYFGGASSEGRSWLAVVHPDDATAMRAVFEAARVAGEDLVTECRIRRFDGPFRWHAVHARAVSRSDGTVESWVGTATDVDDRRHLESSLSHSRRESGEMAMLLQAIESSAPVGFKLVDRDLRILRINRYLAAVNGLPPEQQVGRTVAEVVPELWPDLGDVYGRALAGESIVNLEMTSVLSEAIPSARYWLMSLYPVRLDDQIVGVGTVAVDITERKQLEQAIQRNLDAMVETIARTVEQRDAYTAGHQRRVAELSEAIALELDLDAPAVQGIRTAASIHDIGKISIPGEILSKPIALTPVEFELVKQHARAGHDIVAGVDFPWPVAEMILQHHERLDGSGYPSGLRADEIRLGSRIIAVADVVEAMTSHRPYRPGFGIEAALQLLERERGMRLDPEVVDACASLVRSGRVRLDDESRLHVSAAHGVGTSQAPEGPAEAATVCGHAVQGDRPGG